VKIIEIVEIVEIVGDSMADMEKRRKEELRELANKGWGALSWIKLSEPLEKRLERIEKEISH
jgi:hypothetical protein